MTLRLVRIHNRGKIGHRPGVSFSQAALFFSIGTRVGLIFFLSAAIPLIFRRLQKLIAANPSGKPWLVSAKLECIRMPQALCDLRRPPLSQPLLLLLVIRIAFVAPSEIAQP